MTNQYKDNQSQSYSQLQQIAQGLYATPTTQLPFDPRFEFKSFILERDGENIIIYHSGHLKDVQPDIKKLGGAAKVLMNHDHESLGGPNQLDIPYVIHQDDAKALTSSITIHEYFNERQMLYDDLEVIPTPGHTPGTTMFLWDNGEHRYLFTGDFLCFEGDTWRTVILGSSDRESSIQSLELIKSLDFDVLGPWVSIKEGPVAYFVENDDEIQRQIQNIIDRVRDGENS
ncbi:MBL fold hydrolase [Staphylococcus warneri]|uniref:MBL fold hydrolase n=1 Tax=Staphylococcus warneri TaxID=1292 RepID=A0A2T4Q411_STAWA|nr:MBL fold metallo-hydrolase [Staphylococcus warneri]PTI52729.1 MBL fold hydrolase [Staphylococcus warneri]